ncbi:Chromatin assembly factor 1 subunit, partial [Cryomyces antarcticus]
MKAAPLLVFWHDSNSPIWSAQFEPHGKGRLATAGGDGNVRVSSSSGLQHNLDRLTVRQLWKIEPNGDERRATYLSTLQKHTQPVNVVRWCPRGETLGTAGDDGNVLLWVPSDNQSHPASYGSELEDKETWRVKHMCRSNGTEIYDLAWSPDGVFFITGSMDNVARIYNAQTGQIVRQIAEHTHYVQGVAWDPLNEYIATQSSDRSVHIYSLKTKDGQFTLAQHGKATKMDLPARRISSSSPAPQEFQGRSHFVGEGSSLAIGSPVPSTPSTPTTLALPMNPPHTSHSRRSSFGSSQSFRRSVSPSPSLPLPAIMPSASPNISGGLGGKTAYANDVTQKNASLYASETMTSFFRRLTFTPDGSLLFTPAGQYKVLQPSASGAAKTADEVINTVYVYTRAGLNKPPVAFLPGHKKPSVAVKCSPVYYTLRLAAADTKEITVDTRSKEDDMPPLPEPAYPTKGHISHSSMDPPPLTSAPSPSPSAAASSPRPHDQDSSTGLPAGPPPAFGLQYRMIYAVATYDAVYVYDTQQQKPICVVSNLHYAGFTDLTWSNDGLTLLMTSSDGFCSCLTFAPGELGQIYHGSVHPKHHLGVINTATSSAVSTPLPTPTQTTIPSLPRQPSLNHAPSPSLFATNTPASPARSMSASSITTQYSFAHVPDQNGGMAMNNPTPALSSVPGIAAANSGNGMVGGVPLYTPPQTPAAGSQSAASSVVGVGAKREADSESEVVENSKKRRIAPTLVAAEGAGAVTAAVPESLAPPAPSGSG